MAEVLVEEYGQKNKRNSFDHEKAKLDCTKILSDDIFLNIIITFVPDAGSLARISGVNRRLRDLMKNERVVKRIMENRVAPDHRDLLFHGNGYWTWKELGMYQAMVDAGLMEENRIGFDFASTNIDTDEGASSLIEGSQSRLYRICQVLNRFRYDASLVVDAHCGTRAPPGIAPAFSLARAHVVCGELIEHLEFDIFLANQVILNPWGRRVALQATVSSHRYGEIARKGRGWVELYVRLGGMELPKRPSYYDGLQAFDEDAELRRNVFF